MSKRHEPIKGFTRSNKKAKLDISINAGRITASSSTKNLAGVAGAPAKCAAAAPNAALDNFFEDEDDDFILLASQIADSHVSSAHMVGPQITESEITFSDFVPQMLRASTSTQRQAADINKPQETLDDIFNDDDDDMMMLACAGAGEAKENIQQEQVVKQKRQITNVDSAHNVFKLPAPKLQKNETPKLPAKSAATAETAAPTKPTAATAAAAAEPMLFSQLPADLDATSCSQTTARRQLASERQIKFLMERVNALKRENFQMSKDLEDTRAKMQSKEGETSVLRHEMRHLKQQLQSVKMDNLVCAEAARKESRDKIAELNKQMEAKQTELELRNVEYSRLRMRHADETRRLEMSIRHDMTTMETEENEEEIKEQMSSLARRNVVAGTSAAPRTKSATAKHAIMRLSALTLAETIHATEQTAHTTQAAVVPGEIANIFLRAHERGTSKIHPTVFQQELETMQMLLALLQSQREQPTEAQFTVQQQEQFQKRTIDSVCNVFSEMWSYVHSLEYPNSSCRIATYHAYDVLKDNSDTPNRSLFQPNELHEGERAVSLRRYIAALSVLCRFKSSIAGALLDYQHGQYMLLQIAIDAINKLGYSRELCEHFGLLEALALLLRSLLNSQDALLLSKGRAELLLALLKSLIFCRPSAWVFQQIAHCITLCARLPLILELLCVNSAATTFHSDQVHHVYEFSMDSCVLQVYAGLLEIAFPLHMKLRPAYVALLIAILENHARFLCHCFDEPPSFLHDLLPSSDIEDDEDQSAAGADVCHNAQNNSSHCSNNATPFNSNMNMIVSNNNSSTSSKTQSASESRRHINCSCYMKLCLSFVSLLFQTLWQWRHSEGETRSQQQRRMAHVIKMCLQLLYTIFYEFYIPLLFLEMEEATRHYLHLICSWCSEDAEIFSLMPMQLHFLQELQSSHIMPRAVNAEENLSNISDDVKEWLRISGDTTKPETPTSDVTVGMSERMVKQLKLLENACDAEHFEKFLRQTNEGSS